MSTATAVDQTLAQEQAAGLRLLADMIEQNPQLAANFEHTFGFSGIFVHVATDDVPTEMAAFGRIARRYGATTEKAVNEAQFNLVCDFGALKLKFLANRVEVCERVVTGTETVTKIVKDPTALAAVPEVEITEDVETFKWVCKPLLAADDGAA